MKKVIISLVITLFFLLIILIGVLSTIGIETNKFNILISNKISQTQNFKTNLETIKFKINLKELSLFLETQNPKINYKNLSIPVQNIQVYIDFLSLLKSDLKIKKTNIILEELDISQINKLSEMIKPSNFKSFLNNKIKEGKLISEIEIFLSNQGKFENFIARGTVRGLKAELFSGLNLSDVDMSFFADKNDILIKNIYGSLEDIKISDGDIKLNLENGIKINSNFDSKLNYSNSLYNKYSRFLNKYKFADTIKTLKVDLNNNLYIDLDNTYKVKNYEYDISGKLEKSYFELLKPIKNDFFYKPIKKIYLTNFKLSSRFSPKKISIKGEGKYSFNEKDYLKINIENSFNNDLTNLIIDFDFKDDFKLDLINYKKTSNSIANISLGLEKYKDVILFKNLNFQEEENLIKINNLKLNGNKLTSFKKIEVKTQNNDFYIKNGKKILVKGGKFDATNLGKFLKGTGKENLFQKISNEIEIDFQSIKVPMSENLMNFKLIGEIKKGQFVKISSKGDFGGNNFLDISMKMNKNSQKRYLEIYSDLTRPLLTDYSFFDGLSGGKLLFTSIIDGSTSDSKLKIEDFKVVSAPGVIKLLSLADLRGLADLAEGEGLTFDVLEISMKKNKNFLKLNEILALGPSMSVIMEGYQDENGLTSLKGTLVPAKTVNKMISKIPVIGNIVIPKEAGEGLFGVSFKMKGPRGKIKTTINPIRTLTPRFIQKIIDKRKETK